MLICIGIVLLVIPILSIIGEIFDIKVINHFIESFYFSISDVAIIRTLFIPSIALYELSPTLADILGFLFLYIFGTAIFEKLIGFAMALYDAYPYVWRDKHMEKWEKKNREE